MKTLFTNCLGTNCPSKNNCKRFVDREEHSIPAAIHARREAGASACDMYLPIKVLSTFEDPS